MSFDEIFCQIKTNNACKLLEITGGEPLRQSAVHRFMARALDENYEVLLETSGSLDISLVPANVRKIIDLKPPSSGEMHKNRWENFAHLQPWDEIKALVSDRKDYEWACQIIEKHNLDQRVTVLFSPVFQQISYEKLATWILQDQLNVRLQLQLHKHVWDPATRKA